MGIIKTISSLFKNQQQQEITTHSHIDDIDAERLYEEKQLLYILDKTLKDADRYDVAKIIENKENERKKSYRINFHFIPERQNFKNVRSFIEYKHRLDATPWQKWQDIRLHYFEKHNNICQSCQKTFTAKTLHLHEFWKFDDRSKTQKLVKLIPLCAECHSIAHINMSNSDTNKFIALIEKYRSYNNVSEDVAFNDFDLVNIEREKRKSIAYFLDMSMLSDFLDTCDMFDPHEPNFEHWLETKFTKKDE